MSEIDWNVELRKVSRQFDGLPPEPPPGMQRLQKVAEERAVQHRNSQVAMFGTWARLALVVALANAVVWWPYPRACGPQLLGYLGAVATIVLGGLWVAACTWRHRMPRTHALALLLVLWGLGLAELELLPRIGYARADAAHSANWRCPG